MAVPVATLCATVKATASGLRQSHSTARCTNRPRPQIMPNRTKRTGTMWPMSLSARSIRYSQPISASKLALARMALAEMERDFLDLQRVRRRRQDVEQDLE